MKLFDDNEKYTEEALLLDSAATASMRKLAKNYMKAGCSIRDIMHIMAMAALSLECELLLERDHEAWKAKKAEEEIS